MTDLIAFIEARLDEDEAAARIISPGGYAPQEWRVVTPRNAGGWHEIRAFDRTNIEPPEAAQDDGGAPVAVAPGGRLEHEHIVRHDPARVLREVEAKRKLLEAHREAKIYYDANRSAPAGEAYGLWTAVRLLAMVWADHPDYRAEWRPE